jgi:hypothetical protein
MTRAETLALEAMIDRCQLSEVLAELSAICDGKAQHIRDNWQDETTARVWSGHARRIETFARKVTV